MIANRMKPLLVAGMMLAAAFSSPSHAGERRDYGRWHYLSAPAGAFVYNSDPAAFVSKSGIFSGTFDVIRTPSHSVYLLRGYATATFTSPQLAPAATAISPALKIVDVAEEASHDFFAPISGCSYESGVCVIRGGN